jgi:hypothetical protein
VELGLGTEAEATASTNSGPVRCSSSTTRSDAGGIALDEERDGDGDAVDDPS